MELADDRATGADEQAVLAAVRPRLAEYAAALGMPGRPVRPGPTQQHRHSTILVFEWAGAPRPGGGGVVVKMHRGPGRALASEEEYRNLRALDAHFGRQSSCRVPRPLDCLPEHQAVVMERVTAPRLDRTVRVAARLFAARTPIRARELCGGAGAWLRILGTWERGARDASALANVAWSRELERMLGDARHAGLSDPTAERVGRALATAGPGDFGVGRVHNDFAPYNVHGDEGAVCLVDFSEMPVGSLQQCAGFFWAALELGKLHPVLADAELSRCQRAFEEGWGRSVSHHWKLWGLVRHLSYLRPAPGGEPVGAALWRRWRLAAVERWLARLAG